MIATAISVQRRERKRQNSRLSGAVFTGPKAASGLVLLLRPSLGARHLQSIIPRDGKPFKNVDLRRISMRRSPDASLENRAKLLREWHKVLLDPAIPPLIAKWQFKLVVSVKQYFLERRKPNGATVIPRLATFG